MATAVHINRPPHSVHLQAWGRADTGWWGCVTWHARVESSTGQADMAIAAWVPAATLSRPGWAGTDDAPRI